MKHMLKYNIIQTQIIKVILLCLLKLIIIKIHKYIDNSNNIYFIIIV